MKGCYIGYKISYDSNTVIPYIIILYIYSLFVVVSDLEKCS